jgi:hypothetical protein
VNSSTVVLYDLPLEHFHEKHLIFDAMREPANVDVTRRYGPETFNLVRVLYTTTRMLPVSISTVTTAIVATVIE